MTPPDRQPPTLKLDGDTVRQIREAKGLTQLYVAEVARVSVDTVSRWENNRTPAVKRDNAEALARALEVDVEAILQKEGAEKAGEGETEAEAEPAHDVPSGKRRRYLILRASVLVLAAAALGLWRLLSSPPLELEAFRRLPAYTPPETEVPVLVTVRSVSGRGARVILREVLPKDWRFVAASVPPDQGPTPDGVVKWILHLDGKPAHVAYLARAPSSAQESSAHTFSGEVVTSDREAPEVSVRGNSRIDLEYIYWADQDGDFHISDAEVLDALERLEEARQLRLDPSDLRNLWGASEYVWDKDRKKFRPANPPE